MGFVLSAATALQEAQRIDLTKMTPLRPFIFGPLARLHRYTAAAEKDGILVGDYSYDLDQNFLWPGRESTSTIDLDYTKVFFDNALLRYFYDVVGVGDVIAPVAGRPNRIRSTATNWKANGTTYPRDSDLLDRDVRVGDIIDVRAVVATVLYSLRSTVTGFVADPVPAVVNAATADANNKPTQAVSASITQVAGTPVNDVVAVASAAAYDSLLDGFISRTYTITVTQGSTGGDATTALLQVRSADTGGDDQDNVVPSAFASPTNIGTKGGTVTFSIDSAHASSTSLFAEQDFVIGQQWTVTFNQDFTAPIATSGGTYTGATDTTYIVRISRGGYTTDPTDPQITVSTTTGVDSSGPTNITAAATPFPIGTQGTTISLDQAGLRFGDIYYVSVEAVQDGAFKTLILQNNLPTQLQTAPDLEVSLYIEQDGLEVPPLRTVPAPGANWEQDQTDITIKAGFQAYDSTWTDGGVQQPLQVREADIYVQYREWSCTVSGQIIDINLIADVETILGTVDPDNPLAWGVYKALQNTATANLDQPAGTAATNTDVVRCAATCGDPATTTPWTDILQMVSKVSDIYALVPLTEDEAIQSAVAIHVISQSVSSVGANRKCFLQATIEESTVVVDATKTTDDLVALATLAQDPDVVATSFSLLTVPAGNAQFITNSVVAGDKVRYLFTLDSFGDEQYTEFTVTEVVSEDALKLTPAHSVAVAVAQRVEIWRNLTKDQLVAQLIVKAAVYSNSRVCYVWPDLVSTSGVESPGYFACAALAGEQGSIASHQGMRNLQLLGFDSLPRNAFFNAAQLNSLGAGGVWVIAQAPNGAVYTRTATTTAIATINSREEMINRNADMIYFAIQAVWEDFIGVANITDFVLDTMQGRLVNLNDRLKMFNLVDRIGPPLFGMELTQLQQDPTNLDHVLASVTVSGPTPNNQNVLTVIL